MASELSWDNIWPLVWMKDRQNRPESRFQRFFRVFSAKVGVTYYPNSILRLYLKSLHQGDPFRLPLWKRVWYFLFWLSIVFSKFHLSCANQKAVAMGVKWHCFVIHIPSHGISSENLEKVEFGAKLNALIGLLSHSCLHLSTSLHRCSQWILDPGSQDPVFLLSMTRCRVHHLDTGTQLSHHRTIKFLVFPVLHTKHGGPPALEIATPEGICRGSFTGPATWIARHLRHQRWRKIGNKHVRPEVWPVTGRDFQFSD